MFSRIIRSLFFVACTITGGLWASYLLSQYADGTAVYPVVEITQPGENSADAGAPAPLGPGLLPQSPGVTGSGPDRSENGHADTAVFVGSQPAFRRYAVLFVAGGGAVGLMVALGISFAMRFVTQEAFDRFFPALVSVLLAMATGWLVAWYIVRILNVVDLTLQIYIQATLVIIFFFIGVNLGLTRASHWENLVRAVSRKSYEGRYPKLLDTSVIIDGRIADICKAGFIEGTLIVPRFVLHELQAIADSGDPLRRARGRRGLDVLKQLQAPDSGVTVEVVEDDPEHVHTVDAKLIAFAKDIAAKVITNDQNLLKVAQIDGVAVMNIHDLANAVKTVVLPDEQMQVRIVREGKEPQQGVGFLDDGTMVVVDGGRDHIGRSVVAVVTSVLQTSNGKMIFTRLQSAGT